ncbi:MAG: dihydroorotate dehydrogenase [Candidatus Moraniibacteriota bacterium]
MKARKARKGIVLECRPEKKGSETIVLRLLVDAAESFNPEAGQFVALLPSVETLVMRRPFTVVDFHKSVLTIMLRVVGINTKFYAQLKAKERIDFIGPQGTEIVFNPKSKRCIFIAGGIGGAAIVKPVRKAISEGKKVTVYLGAKNENQFAGLSFLRYLGIELVTITEDGPGRKGFVTELLEEALAIDGGVSEVIACGPKVMLRKVAEICAQHKNDCQVIVEEIMACGMGACKGCAIFGGIGGKEVKHVCSDGPTFDAKWIDWPKFISASIISVRDIRSPKENVQIDFTCRLGPLTLKYPTMNCSGTLDLDAFCDGSVGTEMQGAFVIKGLSLHERAGNLMPRVCETPSGMLNAIGLEYIGLSRFLKEVLPRLLKFDIPIIANINGNSVDEYAELARRLNDVGLAAIEINISCPNVKAGGMLFGKDSEMAFRVVSHVRNSTNLPLITKLTPNVTNIGPIARAVVDAGTDIISLINTVEGAAIDIWTRRSKIRTVVAGLSGPAIRAIAVAKIIQVARAVEIPIIGMGGNENGYTAAELMMAGASATAFGTSGFSNRNIYVQAIGELAEVAIFHGFDATEKLVGIMLVAE